MIRKMFDDDDDTIHLGCNVKVATPDFCDIFISDSYISKSRNHFAILSSNTLDSGNFDPLSESPMHAAVCDGV